MINRISHLLIGRQFLSLVSSSSSSHWSWLSYTVTSTCTHGCKNSTCLSLTSTDSYYTCFLPFNFQHSIILRAHPPRPRCGISSFSQLRKKPQIGCEVFSQTSVKDSVDWPIRTLSLWRVECCTLKARITLVIRQHLRPLAEISLLRYNPSST
jgi:hypothetical protein